MSQTMYSQTGLTSKTFKIRKTKAKQNQQLMDREQVANLKQVQSQRPPQSLTTQNQVAKQTTFQPYLQDQQQINCYRFPHSSFCGCQSNCLLQSFQPIEILPYLYYGNFVTGLKTKHMLELGITHILNVTSKEYTKREKYFQYLNVDLHYNTDEDAKKFFRLSNRFVKNARDQGGKIFIHSSQLQLGAVMTLGYLIGVQKISFKQGLKVVLKNDLQLIPHFLKQLESYDLEKMAFVSIQRD